MEIRAEMVSGALGVHSSAEPNGDRPSCLLLNSRQARTPSPGCTLLGCCWSLPLAPVTRGVRTGFGRPWKRVLMKGFGDSGSGEKEESLKKKKFRSPEKVF